MENDERREYNQKFVERLLARRPALKEKYQKALETEALTPRVSAEAVGGGIADSPVDVVNETIVKEERPVLFVNNDWIDTVNVSLDNARRGEGPHPPNSSAEAIVKPVMPLVGPASMFSGFPEVWISSALDGSSPPTSWLQTAMSPSSSPSRRGLNSSFHKVLQENQFRSRSTPCTNSTTSRQARSGFSVSRRCSTSKRPPVQTTSHSSGSTEGSTVPNEGTIAISEANLAMNDSVVTIGYPAKAPKRIIPDQNLMRGTLSGPI